jgi:hypothetical protein
MQLLVTTPLQIILVDLNSGDYSLVRVGDGYYYGITHKSGVIVLTHSSGYLRLSKNGIIPTYSLNHLVQPHQIEWIDDYILVANTGLNCISVYDGLGNLVKDVYLNNLKIDDKDKNRLGNHFNSVHKIGEFIYVVAHNYEKSSEVYKLNWPELQVIDIISSKASWAHNVCSFDSGLITCDTKNGGLYELFSGGTIWKANESDSLTRGLAMAGDFIFIGNSIKANRKERKWLTGGIWIVDRKSLKTVDLLKLPGSGEVYDIRVIGTLDECHNDQIIEEKSIWAITYISRILASTYKFRRTHPTFQREWLPQSVMVRSIQMSVRLRNWMIRTFQKTRRKGMIIR